MPANLVWRPRAREDLIDIYEFIALDDQAAAERLITSIETTAAVLARYPRLGPRRPNIRESTRVFVEGAYPILYETHPDTDEGPIDSVEIVRFVDGRRELRNPL
jgi:toxin ParE1/3/4